MLYMITCGLKNKERNFQAVADAIMRLGESNHCLDLVWLLHSQRNVNEIQSEIQRAISEDDRFIVMDVTARPRNGWMNRDVWEWVRAHDF